MKARWNIGEENVRPKDEIREGKLMPTKEGVH